VISTFATSPIKAASSSSTCRWRRRTCPLRLRLHPNSVSRQQGRPIPQPEPADDHAAVAADCPDVGLLDIGLPGMSGYELAAKLRTGGLCPRSLKLVAVTGYAKDPEALLPPASTATYRSRLISSNCEKRSPTSSLRGATRHASDTSAINPPGPTLLAQAGRSGRTSRSQMYPQSGPYNVSLDSVLFV
jgi:CheY-like chemotaxis protein